MFFIALIHPIQWTIAYLVGPDRPAKRQKKTSCVSTGLPVRSTSALARWRVVLPSCLDSMTSWHLFRLARTSVHGNFSDCQFFCKFYLLLEDFTFLCVLSYLGHIIAQNVVPRTKEGLLRPCNGQL